MKLKRIVAMFLCGIIVFSSLNGITVSGEEVATIGDASMTLSAQIGDEKSREELFGHMTAIRSLNFDDAEAVTLNGSVSNSAWDVVDGKLKLIDEGGTTNYETSPHFDLQEGQMLRFNMKFTALGGGTDSFNLNVRAGGKRLRLRIGKDGTIIGNDGSTGIKTEVDISYDYLVFHKGTGYELWRKSEGEKKYTLLTTGPVLDAGGLSATWIQPLTGCIVELDYFSLYDLRELRGIDFDSAENSQYQAWSASPSQHPTENNTESSLSFTQDTDGTTYAQMFGGTSETSSGYGLRRDFNNVNQIDYYFGDTIKYRFRRGEDSAVYFEHRSKIGRVMISISADGKTIGGHNVSANPFLPGVWHEITVKCTESGFQYWRSNETGEDSFLYSQGLDWADAPFFICKVKVGDTVDVDYVKVFGKTKTFTELQESLVQTREIAFSDKNDVEKQGIFYGSGEVKVQEQKLKLVANQGAVSYSLKKALNLSVGNMAKVRIGFDQVAGTGDIMRFDISSNDYGFVMKADQSGVRICGDNEDAYLSSTKPIAGESCEFIIKRTENGYEFWKLYAAGRYTWVTVNMQKKSGEDRTEFQVEGSNVISLELIELFQLEPDADFNLIPPLPTEIPTPAEEPEPAEVGDEELETELVGEMNLTRFLAFTDAATVTANGSVNNSSWEVIDGRLKLISEGGNTNYTPSVYIDFTEGQMLRFKMRFTTLGDGMDSFNLNVMSGGERLRLRIGKDGMTIGNGNDVGIITEENVEYDYLVFHRGSYYELWRKSENDAKYTCLCIGEILETSNNATWVQALAGCTVELNYIHQYDDAQLVWFEDFNDAASFGGYYEQELWTIQNSVLSCRIPVSTRDYVDKHITIPQEFVVTFRFRIPQRGDETYFYLFWEGKHVSVCINERSLLVGNIPTEECKVSDGEWHELKLKSVGRTEDVAIYVDDRLVGTTTKTESASTVTMWRVLASKGGAQGYNAIDLDWVKCEAINSPISISTPKVNTEYTEGESISLSASCDTNLNANLFKSVPNVVFKANGRTIATAPRGVDSFIWLTNPANRYEATVSGLQPGKYEITAEYAGMVSRPVNITVKSSSGDTGANSSLVDDEELQNYSHEISYTISGNSGNVVYDFHNGNHQIRLTHTADAVTYLTDKGEQQYQAGCGRYQIITDGATADVYRNGQFIFSYYLPISNNVGKQVQENGLLISNETMTVPESRKNYFIARNLVENKKVYLIDGISHAHNLDFVADEDDELRIGLNDGYYRTDIEFENGSIYVWKTDFNNSFPYRAEVAKVLPGEVYYRVETVGGMSRLYANGRWLATFRSIHSIGGESLKVENRFGNGIKYLAVTENKDLYLYSDEFDGAGEFDSLDYWLQTDISTKITANEKLSLNAEGKENAITEIAAYVGDLDLSADVTIQKGTGGFWFLFGHTVSNGYSKIGYNFATSQYELVKREDDNVVTQTTASGNLSVGQTVPMRLMIQDTKDGKNVSLFVNEVEVISYQEAAEERGKAGFLLSDTVAEIDNVVYRGDAKVNTSMYQNISSYKGAIAMEDPADSNRIFITPRNGNKPVTADGGITWTVEKSSGYDSDTRLNLRDNDGNFTGEILAIVRKATTINGSTVYKQWAYYSEDYGATWKEQGPVQALSSTVRGTTNKRLVQGDSGRIYLTTEECSEHVTEENGKTAIWYTDNKGITWSKSETELDAAITGHTIAECVIVEMPDGVVRCYARTNLGYIAYFDSFDGGKTFDLTPHPTPFLAATNCFYIEIDPYNPTHMYAAWGYDNVNQESGFHNPRTRYGLARSIDSGETWEYIGTLHEDATHYNTHMNMALTVAKDYVVVTCWSSDTYANTKYGENGVNREIFLDKDKLRPIKDFEQVHMLDSTKIEDTVMMASEMDHGLLVVNPGDGTLFLHGKLYLDGICDDKILVDYVASYTGASINTNEDGSITLLGEDTDVTFSKEVLHEKDGKSFIGISQFVKEFGLIMVDYEGIKVIDQRGFWTKTQLEFARATVGFGSTTEPHLEVFVTDQENSRQIRVNPVNVESNCKVVLATYQDDGCLKEVQLYDYLGDSISFEIDKKYTYGKIMVWNFETLDPILPFRQFN